jgi:hypothetical protein
MKYTIDPTWGKIFSDETILNLNVMKVQQTKVAVFKVTRNEKNEITSTQFLKEMWIQTKPGVSIESEAIQDSHLQEYKPEELSFKTITSTTF